MSRTSPAITSDLCETLMLLVTVIKVKGRFIAVHSVHLRAQSIFTLLEDFTGKFALII